MTSMSLGERSGEGSPRPRGSRDRVQTIAIVLAHATAAFVSVTACVVLGDEAREQRLERELGEVRDELDLLRRRVDGVEEPPASAPDHASAPPDASPPDASPPDASTLEWTPPWSGPRVDRPAALRGIRDKPFLLSIWDRAHIGGYTELEYHSFEDGIQGVAEGFRMHRTNLFLFTDISDTVRFASELEFETEFDGGANSNEIEVAVEMALVDWQLWQEFELRAGVLLPPLGRVNVNHDGPTRELTERPLVSTWVIPTTLSEPGVGAHGNVAFCEEVALEYEIYAVNGFSVLDADGRLAAPIDERESLLRESRSALGGDTNDGLAATGRVGLELFESLAVGGSWHVGTYDERGDNQLRIWAGDLAWVHSIVAVEGEVALADFERDRFARTAGVPDRFWGWYLQAGAGGMPECLRRALPNIFGGEGARFGAALRFDWIDLDGDRGEVIEPGLTFRPVADTVFKFSYRFTPNSFGSRGVPGTEGFDDEGFVFSFSTYF